MAETKIRSFLETNPLSPLEGILEYINPNFSHLTPSERFQLWNDVRSVLRHLEAEGEVECDTEACGNLWRVAHEEAIAPRPH